MQTPGADILLQVWEAQQHAHPVQRALHALAAATPERGWQGWATAPIGQREAALMDLHALLFGPALHTTTACPRCGERLELDFTTDDIRSPVEPTVTAAGAALHWQQRGYDIEYRLPTSQDLLQVTGNDAAGDAGARPKASAETRLLQLCIRQARQDGHPLEPAALPAEVVSGLAADMARHDPDADVQIALECPACGHAWPTRFDIVSHFWAELDDWAHRLLDDVHVLAHAYGWAERDILGLSPGRRQQYLQRVWS